MPEIVVIDTIDLPVVLVDPGTVHGTGIVVAGREPQQLGVVAPV
jgi:hypothetical protein